MRRKVLGVVLVLLFAAVLAAQESKQAALDLQAAIRTQTIDGDLRKAIRQYEAIVSKHRNARAVVAQALFQMAESYQKLGDLQAQTVYQRVVTEYADQKELASSANSRLKRNAGAAHAVSNRVVWSYGNGAAYFWGNVSRDGRYIAYGNPRDNNLYLHDFTTGTDRQLTNTGTMSRDRRQSYGDDVYSFSRDGRQLAYSWSVRGGEGEENREELRVINISGSGFPQPRVLLSDSDIRWVTPFDWLPDGQTLVVGLWRKTRKDSQLALMSVRDGTLRILKTVPDATGASMGGVYVSPDGRFLTVSPRQKGSNGPRDVLVLDLATNGEIPALAEEFNDSALGWAPDGKQILFISDRIGYRGIWGMSFDKGDVGRPALMNGAPPCVACSGLGDSDVAGFGDPLGVSATGAFYYRVRPQPFRDFKTASLDVTTGRVTAQGVVAFSELADASSWSPNGEHVIYFQRNPARLLLRSNQTGKTLLLTAAGTTPNGVTNVWSPDGRGYAFVASREGKDAVYRVDVTTGEIQVASAGATRVNAWTRDGRIFVERPAEGNEVSLIECDLSTKSEREVFRISSASRGTSRALSPDGRTLFYRRPVSGNTQPHDLVARDLSSGADRVLTQLTVAGALHPSPDARYVVVASSPSVIVSATGDRREVGAGMSFLAWSPDSRAAIFRTILSASPDGRTTAWWVPVDGAKPHALDLNIDLSARDFVAYGNRVAYVQQSPRQPDQVWILENFLTSETR